jgi:hypothetical protein
MIDTPIYFEKNLISVPERTYEARIVCIVAKKKQFVATCREILHDKFISNLAFDQTTTYPDYCQGRRNRL